MKEYHLLQYRILMEKLQALATSNDTTANLEEAYGEIVLLYIHCGAPYGLKAIDLITWMRELAEDRRAPFVLSA